MHETISDRKTQGDKSDALRDSSDNFQLSSSTHAGGLKLPMPAFSGMRRKTINSSMMRLMSFLLASSLAIVSCDETHAQNLA